MTVVSFYELDIKEKVKATGDNEVTVKNRHLYIYTCYTSILASCRNIYL